MTCPTFLPLPKQPKACLRCGRVERLHPEPARQRDVNAERAIAFQVTQEDDFTPPDRSIKPVLQFAHKRAHPGPVDNHEGRDFFVDVLEELADAVNYAIWGLQQLDILHVPDAERGELWAAYSEVLNGVKGIYNRLACTYPVYREVLR